MKFFFPDSSDLVDPSFDFDKEVRSATRLRQRDDLYAHEVFDRPPFDGVLVSKAIVDGSGASGGRYTLAQRHRLLRHGVRHFFRLDRKHAPRLETMGDCGAFSYVKEKEPPYTPQEVLDFYSECGFDKGVSVDHVILGFNAECEKGLPGIDLVPDEWRIRVSITLEMAAQFLSLHTVQKHRFEPIGVAQGWSPASYANSVRLLQDMGYRYIAIGGIVPLKTREILDSLKAVSDVRRPDTRLHLFGVTRTKEVDVFSRYGVASFDSTSPLRQAFKDDKDNYYTIDGALPAIRVPQVEGNPKLQRRIAAGLVDHDRARELERACLNRLKQFDAGSAAVDDVLERLREYEKLHDESSDRSEVYRQVLEERPWTNCPCDVCTELGIHVVVFRGAERNRRRGFHNLFVFYQRLHRELGLDLASGRSPRLPKR